MNLVLRIGGLALQQFSAKVCATLGLEFGSEAAAKVTDFFAQRFTNHSERLLKALQTANERAWRTLEFALAGDSLWDRLTGPLARADDKDFRAKLRRLLDEQPYATIDRHQCLVELGKAREEGYLRASSGAVLTLEIVALFSLSTRRSSQTMKLPASRRRMSLLSVGQLTNKPARAAWPSWA